MGRELIERRHRAIPPVLLASKYGESASLVTFLLLTCLNVVFLVAQMQQEKQVLIISRVIIIFMPWPSGYELRLSLKRSWVLILVKVIGGRQKGHPVQKCSLLQKSPN